MKALMLGAGLAAIFGAPVLAQPYGQGQDQPDPYYDQGPPPQAQQPPPSPGGYQGGYDQQGQGYGQYQPPPPPPPGQPGFQNYQGDQGDQGYPDGQSYQGYQGNQGYYQGYQGYQANPGYQGYQGYPAYQPYGGYGQGGARYTGRVSQSWRNDEGRYCVYREVTWIDRNGQPAYRWVPRCR